MLAPMTPPVVLVLFSFLLADFVGITQCANILGIFPAPGYSQFILGEKLMRELVRKGHNVTMISAYRPDTVMANFTVVDVPEVAELYKTVNFFKSVGAHYITTTRLSQQSGLLLTERTLASRKVQGLLHSDSTFDLVILEQFFDEALTGFASHFQAPLVLFSSIGPCEWNNHIMGNPILPSIMPSFKMDFTTKMTMNQRFQNALIQIFDALYKRLVVYPEHDRFLKKYFPGPKKMNLEDVMYNASLMLLNSHFSITNAYPLVPSMVEIGGFHIETKGMSEDLKKFMDEARDGVIYFSMGTNLNASAMDETNLKQKILGMFSALTQRVVWKSDEDTGRVSDNVWMVKWVSQVDVLAHPNTKLFISHGGLLSTIEAVHYGIPMIMIPIFGDQYMNSAKAAENGFAIVLSYDRLSEERLRTAIREILQNKSYTENVTRRSRLLHDQVVPPLDLAIHWIEYVLRHKGAPELRSPVLELYWYQFYYVDIIGLSILFILLCNVIAGFVFIKFCKRSKASKSVSHDHSRSKKIK